MKPSVSAGGRHGVEWAITAFAAWQSADLVSAWRHAPLERGGWLAFAVWILPLLLNPRLPEAPRPLWPASVALALALMGTLGSLNAACYAGLALAVVGQTGWSMRRALWLASAIAWMPLLGWLSRDLSDALRLPLRLLIAGCGILPMVTTTLRTPSKSTA